MTERNALKKAILKSCAFAAIIGILITMLSPVFIWKTMHRGKLQEGMYDSDDQYDVIFMGSSHMNGGVDPNVLWKEKGITSFNYATGGQPIEVTYYLLKDILKKHKNPVVVLDVFYLGMTTQYGEFSYLSNSIDNMDFSWNKLEAIWNCVPLGDRISCLFPFLKYHFRWSSLQKNDLTFDNASVYYAKGFEASTDRYGKDISSVQKTENRIDIPPESLDYLNKIVALCKEQNCSLMFVNMPCDYSDTDGAATYVDDFEALFNSVADYADEHGIPFLDFYDRMDEVNLDFANDMHNASHLNLNGAYKVSDYFADYLIQNYNLTDHRSDSAYAQWDTDFQKSQVASILS